MRNGTRGPGYYTIMESNLTSCPLQSSLLYAGSQVSDGIYSKIAARTIVLPICPFVASLWKDHLSGRNLMANLRFTRIPSL